MRTDLGLTLLLHSEWTGIPGRGDEMIMVAERVVAGGLAQDRAGGCIIHRNKIVEIQQDTGRQVRRFRDLVVVNGVLDEVMDVCGGKIVIGCRHGGRAGEGAVSATSVLRDDVHVTAGEKVTDELSEAGYAIWFAVLFQLPANKM